MVVRDRAVVHDKGGRLRSDYGVKSQSTIRSWSECRYTSADNCPCLDTNAIS